MHVANYRDAESRSEVTQSDSSQTTAVRAAHDPAIESRYERLANCLESAREGDNGGLVEFVSTLTPLLWQVAREQGLAHADAEDAVQTAWLRLLRHLDDIRSPRALTAWLITATRREAWQISNASRRRRMMGPEPLEELADPTPNPEQLAYDYERWRCLWNNIQKLPPRCRELLRIVAFADRPDYQSVAQALRMPLGSIGPTRGRCLAKLRALLTNDSSWSHP